MFALQARDHGNDALQFLGFADSTFFRKMIRSGGGTLPARLLGSENRRAWPSRFAAYVEDVGSILKQLHSVCDSLIGIEVQSAIGKRVRCHVDDTHHQRAFSQLKKPRPQTPFKYWTHGSILDCGLN